MEAFIKEVRILRFIASHFLEGICLFLFLVIAFEAKSSISFTSMKMIHCILFHSFPDCCLCCLFVELFSKISYLFAITAT